MHWERNHISLIGKSLVVGAVASLSAIAYRAVLSKSDALCHTLFHFADSPLHIALLFLFLILVGLIVGRITESEPLIKGSGIPQLEGQFHGHLSPNPLAVLVKKFIGGALCIVCGLSLGREGPSIQLGAMTGQLTEQRLPKSNDEDKKLLLLCGACAGLASAFNAPLAGIAQNTGGHRHYETQNGNHHEEFHQREPLFNLTANLFHIHCKRSTRNSATIHSSFLLPLQSFFAMSGFYVDFFVL